MKYYVGIHLDAIRPPVNAVGDAGKEINANVLDWMMCSMGIVTSISGALVVFKLDRFIVRHGTLLIMLVGYLSTFFVLRLGTMRIMNNFGNGMLSSVNHRETDELIYEVMFFISICAVNDLFLFLGVDTNH